jgi:hypothetical protein
VLTAIDMRKGTISWQTSVGSIQDVAPAINMSSSPQAGTQELEQLQATPSSPTRCPIDSQKPRVARVQRSSGREILSLSAKRRFSDVRRICFLRTSPNCSNPPIAA